MLVGLNSRSKERPRNRAGARASAAITAGVMLAAGAVLPAHADEPSEERVLIPPEQVSIQMFSLNPWVSQTNVKTVLEGLAEIGFQNIEPWGGTFSGYSASQFKELTSGLGISVPSSHYNVGESDFDDTLVFIDTLG